MAVDSPPKKLFDNIVKIHNKEIDCVSVIFNVLFMRNWCNPT